MTTVSTTHPHPVTGPAPTQRRLIVNADDFGYTLGVNRGIIEAHCHGILTSATIMANGAAFEDAVARGREHSTLGIGVHVNLVEGSPVSAATDVPSLVGKDGRFHSKTAIVRRHLTGRLSLDELQHEIETQIDRVRDAGVAPTHMDSHQHVHTYPPFFRVFLDVARSRGIRAIRLPVERLRMGDILNRASALPRYAAVMLMCQLSRPLVHRYGISVPDAFAGVLQTGAVSPQWLLKVLQSLRPGLTEIMVHPGYSDHELSSARTRLTAAREGELRALLDPRVVEYVRTRSIQLADFGEIDSTRVSTPVPGSFKWDNF